MNFENEKPESKTVTDVAAPGAEDADIATQKLSRDAFRDIRLPFPDREPERTKSGEPLSKLEMDGTTREIADQLIKNSGFDKRSEGDIQKLLSRAADNGQLELVIDKINALLRQSGSDLSLSYTDRHQQDKTLPELSAFNSWREYTLNVNKGNEVKSSLTFDANHVHHPGMYHGFPQFPRPSFNYKLPGLIVD